VVPADKLAHIARESTDDVLRVETVENVCHIRGGDSHFQMFTRPVEEFPPVPQPDQDEDFELPVRDLRLLSDWTVFAAARENTRYAINGVLWDVKPDQLTMVATDGRRLSKAVHPLEFEGGAKAQSAIVPIKGMQVLSRMLADPEARVAVKITPSQLVLQSPRTSVTSALLEGHFPAYEEVIPTDCDKRVEFATDELLSAVKRAALLSNEESKGVKLSFTSGKLTISSRTPEQGEAVVELPVDYQHADTAVGFNPAFLMDVLRVAAEDTVVFEFKEPTRPGIFRCGESFLYVVMPVNLA
jgi:DNA polymerase-3 subunit beta